MRAISKAMSKELRHENHVDRQRGGFMPLATLLEAPSIRELFATRREILQIVRGDGGNHKLRFEMRSMQDKTTVSVRASQGNSASSGVADDMLPVADDLVTLFHGATLVAAHSIVHDGVTPGLGGFVPASCILCVRQLPSYKVLRPTLSKRWGSTSAPVLGLGYGEKGDRT